MLAKAKAFFTCSLLIIIGQFVRAQSGTSYADLSQGKWYKIATAEEGVYKLDIPFLNSLGIDTEAIDPGNLRLFGFGGGMLPQSVSEDRYEGLPEIPLSGNGTSDGRLSSGDYLLFYVQGPHRKAYNIAAEEWEYEKNLYADSTYLFLTVGDVPGKRVQSSAGLSGTHQVISTSQNYTHYEPDEINILQSGREWYGSKISSLGSSAPIPSISLPGVVTGSDVKIKTRVANFATTPATFSLKINGSELGSIYTSRTTDDSYGVKVTTSTKNFIFTASGSDLNTEVEYEGGTDPRATGSLDYISFYWESRIELNGNSSLIFQNPATLNHPSVTYNLAKASTSTQVWDITDPLTIKKITTRSEGTSLSFSVPTTFGKLDRFIAFEPSQITSPSFIKEISNQDLRNQSPPDLLIITHPSLLPEANRLASFRQSNDKMGVTVTTVEEVYNAFSSGRQDITAIRDYVHHLYTSQPGKLKYLLLFGYASYDYKNRIQNNVNLVPTYQSRNSYHNVYSYSSDDYFGFLEDHEGEWVEESTSNDHSLEIGIGRLPAKTAEEARLMVDKLIHYYSPASLGNWRSKVVFVADDGDENTHQRDADKLATYVDTTHSNYNIRKIYLDAFRQQVKATRETSPAAREALSDAVKNGAFIINYSGHGGPAGWTAESILDQSLILQWENLDKLPIFVTATCEFGQHDNPTQVSAGEQLLLNAQGGAIGLVTTTRPVYAYTNYLLNREFYKQVFPEDNHSFKRLGEIFRNTKNQAINGVNNRNFTLLGDPSMMPAFPPKKINITGINGKDPRLTPPTLGAQEHIFLTGEVTASSGGTDQSFNGVVSIVLFDKDVNKQTFGTEGTSPMSFQERDNVLFRGQATVRNGIFSTEFIMPKNLNYTLGNGKLSLYAYETDNLDDALGADNTVKIGGTSEAITTENIPPEIKLYLNDTTFQNGSVISPTADVLAFFKDDSGINISNTGIGQGIMLTIDGENQVLLNDFYQSNLDDYTSGKLTYPLSGLSAGSHTITLTAWDNQNNRALASLDFIVSENGEFLMENAGNYPNPFSNTTVFTFTHNLAGENLNVQIEIMDTQGRSVALLEDHILESPSTINTIEWDGTDSSGRPLPSGVYIYKIFVETGQSLKKAVVKRLVYMK